MRIRGHGPAPCEFMVVSEGPNWEEDKCGLALSGRKIGEELDRFLNGDDLPTRRDMFLTSIFREYRGKEYLYTDEDLKADEPDLVRELVRVQPKIIITLGRYSTRWFLGDVDMESTQGIPWYLPIPEPPKIFPCDDRIVFPIIHPSAGMFNSEMANYVVSGFKQLAMFLEGDLAARKLFDDPLAGKERYKLLIGDEVWEHLKDL